MSKKIQFSLNYDEDLDLYLEKSYPDVLDYRILSQSLDARRSNRGRKPTYNYVLEVLQAKNDQFERFFEEVPNLGALNKKPIIVGAGPAGLFCALRLVEHGIPCILLERGQPAYERMKHISQFWRYGKLDEDNNVCYGEGGAGLFSDGKLITRIKSSYVKYVMQKLVDFGAPEETAYLSNPHLGSNKIRKLIGKMSEYLQKNGCDIHYNACVKEILFESVNQVKGVQLRSGKVFETDNLILATGHSATQMYHYLQEKNVSMKPKNFAIGVRIEHPRKLIDHLQYGEFAKELGAARYRLSWEDSETLKGCYSFCMCPGGYVLSAGTEKDGIVVNGMSNYARNSPWSNAALVVSTEFGKDFNDKELLSGLYFQREIEKKAHEWSLKHATGREVPAQTLQDFLNNKVPKELNIKTSCPSSLVSADMRAILPPYVISHLEKALQVFDKRIPGFVSDQALLLAPETRTSAPVTILRDRKTLESLSHRGLYPCGEGAGYAGGITSAAVDGIHVAMALLKKEKGYEKK